MSIEWRYSETDCECVVLIAKLLELVNTALPKGGELDLDTIAGDHPVGLGIAAGNNIEPLRGTPTSYKLLANFPNLP